MGRLQLSGQSLDGISTIDSLSDAPSTSTAAIQPPMPQSDAVQADRRTKLELWNDIKTLAFSRTITAIYVVCLLSLQSHVQLNILGRHKYVSSVLSLSRTPEGVDTLISEAELAARFAVQNCDTQLQPGVSSITEAEYLTFSWWLLHRGWLVVAARVKEAVVDVFGR